jgi:hypothetical protein
MVADDGLLLFVVKAYCMGHAGFATSAATDAAMRIEKNSAALTGRKCA